jgi:hypothetical protein
MNKYRKALGDIVETSVYKLTQSNLVDKNALIGSCFLEQTKTLNELVDKEMPKKPIILEKQFYYFECPNCHDKTTLGEPKRCCECGQLLDWSKDETQEVR